MLHCLFTFQKVDVYEAGAPEVGGMGCRSELGAGGLGCRSEVGGLGCRSEVGGLGCRSDMGSLVWPAYTHFLASVCAAGWSMPVTLCLPASLPSTPHLPHPPAPQHNRRRG